MPDTQEQTEQQPLAQDEIPVSKVARAGKFFHTGLKVGGNYLSYYGKKALLQKPDREQLSRDNAEDLLEGFTELRGSALKVAQMLAMDSVNLSQSFTEVFSRAQYQVPPMSAPLAIQVFTKTIGRAPEQVFDKFNPIASRAASMGQVHEAWLGGKKLAVKIQYPGVADSVKSDLAIVKRFAPALVKASAEEIEPYFQEVQAKLLEETDYALELQQSLAFSRDCAHLPGLIFPTYYPELCGSRVLTMSWLQGGLHLKEWLATQPTPETITRAAQAIWDLYDYQVHVLKRVNADPHPGNFLFMPDGTVGVLDFGCTKAMTQALYDDYFVLAKPDIMADDTRMEQAMRKLEILRPGDNPEKVQLIKRIFVQLIGKLTTPIRQGHFYFNDRAYLESVAALGMEISKLRELRGSKEFLFVNRTFFGLFALMQQMDVTLHTQSAYWKP